VSFVNPILLWGLLAAALPIIIHLINRWRHKTIKWGAMSFLLKATREARGRKKLQHYIILAMRALAIAALVTAVARPRTSNWLGVSSSGVDNVLLILDRSSSMETRSEESAMSLRAQALEKIKKTMPELANTRLALLDSASGKVQEIASPDVLDKLSATSASDSQADLPGLLGMAADWLSNGVQGKTEIWIASDLQKSNWHAEDGRWSSVRERLKGLQPSPALRILGMSQRPLNNNSIRVNSAQREGDELVLDVEIRRSNANAAAEVIPFTISLNGASEVQSINMNKQSISFQRRLKLDKNSGKGIGYVALDPDSNPRDDKSYFVYGANTKRLISVVSSSDASRDTLVGLAGLPQISTEACQQLSPAESDKINWQEASLVIWQGDLPEGVTAQRAELFLNNGGSMLFLPPAEEAKQVSFLGMNWGETLNAAKDEYFVIEKWDHKEGVLRDGSDGRQLPVNRLKAIKQVRIEGESLAVAEWADYGPAIAARSFASGQALFLGSRADYTWSNLADADVLLPLVVRLAKQGQQRFSSANMYMVGDPGSMALANQTKERMEGNGKEEHAASNIDYLAGVYRVAEREFAVNRPLGEDDIVQLEAKQLEGLLGGLSFRLFEQKGSDEDALVSEAWRNFFVIMLIALLVEAALSLPGKYLSNKKPVTRETSGRQNQPV